MWALDKKDFIMSDNVNWPYNIHTLREHITANWLKKYKNYNNDPFANIPHIELYNNTATNCNSSTTWTVANFWNITWPNSNQTLFEPYTAGIIIKEDCTVEATCNMYFEGSTQRTNVGIEFTINWTRQNIMWASDYIRNQNWHNEASTSISQILELVVWDTVWVKMYQLANNGTVSAPSGKSNLSLKVIK